MPCVSARAADAVVKRSRLLARLALVVPEIVTGPLRLDAQYWVSTGKPGFLPASEPTLGESRFVDPSDGALRAASTKPSAVGLFTSTGVLGTHGMWRTYLDLNRGSTLYPPPWHTWAVAPRRAAAVREIASAAEWVDLVRSHPRREHGLLCPDWGSVARHHDAVHMTLRAIVAIQGLHLTSGRGTVAAPYWDVESTLWLRWCFDSVRFIETVNGT